VAPEVAREVNAMLMDMVAVLSQPPNVDERRLDQRVFLFDQSFDDYEALLAMRGERGVPRIYYLEGTIELMSPSIDHEAIKSTIGRLVEAAADELAIDVNAYGSWTVKDRPEDRGAEPDECYVVGGARKDRPDFAIEVQWTGGGLDKLDIYRGLGVREVWVWSPKSQRIEVWVLEGDAYRARDRSLALPQIDLAVLARFVTMENQSEAVRAYRKSLGAD
jgi:Uma2 family endonuclease